MSPHRSTLAAAAVALIALLIASAIDAHDRVTWLLEIFPILIALPLLAATYRPFPLTRLLYACIFAHAIVLMVGGHYTYARVPIGFDVAQFLGMHRNPYDKLGHFFQGFVPALLTREILIRGRYVQGPRMLAFIVLCIVLAISAAYELVEWGAAIALGQGADDFLGTQGDPWDTQTDMLAALVGGVAALVTLSRVHDREIARVETQRGR